VAAAVEHLFTIGGRGEKVDNGTWMRRWDKQYSAWYLDDLPHKRLTRPAKAFEYFFDGARKGRGRENILRMEVGHVSR